MTTSAIVKTTENAPAQSGDAFALTPEIRQAWEQATTAAGALAAAQSVERTTKTALVYTLAAAAIVSTSKDATEACKVSAITGALALEYPDAPAITGLEMVHRAAQRITNGAILAKLDRGSYADTRAYLVAQLTHTDEDGKQHLANVKDLTAISADDVPLHLPQALTATDPNHPEAEAIKAAQAKHVAFIASGGKKANAGSGRGTRGAGTPGGSAPAQDANKPGQPSSATATREQQQRAQVVVTVAKVASITEAIGKLTPDQIPALIGRMADPKHGLSRARWEEIVKGVLAQAERIAAEAQAQADAEAEAAKEAAAQEEPTAAQAVDAITEKARKKAETQAKRAATIARKKAEQESAERISA